MDQALFVQIYDIIPHAIMPRKRAFKEGFPEKMTTTEASCDETAQHVKYYKLPSFCDKRVKGQKENYFDTKKDKTPHRVFAWLVGSHEVGLIGNNESTISSNTSITHR